MEKMFKKVLKLVVALFLVVGLAVSSNSNVKVHAATVTFEQQFKDAHTAEVMAKNFNLAVTDEIGTLATTVTYLNLSEKMLTDLTGIEIFANLRELKLNNNELTSIPSEIGTLVNLRRLVLDFNKLTALPAEIGNLTNLVILNADMNEITTLPVEIGNLVNLKELSVSGNPLSSLPTEIGNLAKLTSLSLMANGLQEIPAELFNLTNLTMLDLAFNELTTLPAEVGNLVNLTELNVSFNMIEKIPAEISNLKKLTALYIGLNNLSELPAEIGSLTSLEIFNLAFNQLTTLPNEIGNLSNLTALYLAFNQLTNLPTGILNLNKVAQLDLSGNFVPTKSIELMNALGFTHVVATDFIKLGYVPTARSVYTINSSANLEAALADVTNDLVLVLPDGTTDASLLLSPNHKYAFDQFVDESDNPVNINNYFTNGAPNATVTLRAKVKIVNEGVFADGSDNAVTNEYVTLNLVKKADPVTPVVTSPVTPGSSNNSANKVVKGGLSKTGTNNGLMYSSILFVAMLVGVRKYKNSSK